MHRAAIVIAAPVLFLVAFLSPPSISAAEDARLELTVVDASGAPLPCRVHLRNPQGEPVRAEGLPFFRDHFVCAGQVSLPLVPGRYEYEIERGPEFARLGGKVELAAGKTFRVEKTLPRIADLAKRGWYSGELHIHRDLADIELLMQAEDLHVGPVITWWNGRNQWKDRAPPEQTVVRFDGDRYYEVLAGEDERQGGALMYFGLEQPLPLPGDRRAFPEWPSPMKFVRLAREQKGAWIDVEKPFWWDVPVWLAGGKVDSIGLANNHMCRSTMYESEAWGRPRDAERLPAPRGNGFWTQEIYYHVLDSGLRIPPSAGSASGVLPNPVGYNRVYVHTGDDFSYESWWRGLKQGRSFVTNGPLLVCRANGELPGAILRADAGRALEVDVEIDVKSNDPALRLEIVKNGEPQRDEAHPRGLLDRPAPARLRTKVRFERSGWLLVRAIADNEKTFRFASTAPFYVEIGGQQRISRSSAKFFVDWVDERIKQIESTDLEAKRKREVLEPHLAARDFWRRRLAAANVD